MGTGCRVKSTGKVIEWQSNPSPGTLIGNAVVAGYAAEDVEEFQVSYQDFMAQVPKTWGQIRKERNGKLLASDWTQLPDVPLTTKLKWATYRQKLRDVPQEFATPTLVAWPTPPK